MFGQKKIIRRLLKPREQRGVPKEQIISWCEIYGLWYEEKPLIEAIMVYSSKERGEPSIEFLKADSGKYVLNDVFFGTGWSYAGLSLEELDGVCDKITNRANNLFRIKNLIELYISKAE